MDKPSHGRSDSEGDFAKNGGDSPRLNHDADRTPVTQIIYTKTSCYFCNEWLENDSFKDHLGSCSQTLIECPNACSAYIQRRQLADHLRACPRTTTPSSLSSTEDEAAADSDSRIKAVECESDARIQLDHLQSRLIQLEQDITFVRTALNEETRQRHKLIVDVGTLRRRSAVEDEWTLKVGDVLAAFKKCLGEETESRCIDVQQVRLDIGRLELVHQEINEWRLEMQSQLDQVEHDVVQEGSLREYIDVLMKDNRISALKIYGLENDVKLLRQRSEDAHRISATNDALLIEKMSQIDEFLEANQRDHGTQSHESSATDTAAPPLGNNSPYSLVELTEKLGKLDFEMKSLKHITVETEDKCDKLERIVVESRKCGAQTRQLLADLEEHLRLQRSLGAIQNVDGHLVWRIAGFAGRLEDAKRNEVTVQSPLFCNRQYGYTLRLDVHLNGIGTWKGRNILACLTVVNGEYDALLPWPCKLQADITLRDQPDDLTKAKNLSKTIVAKGNVDAYEQGQFIFIPHKELKREHFLRNDAIYFEVRVHPGASAIST